MQLHIIGSGCPHPTPQWYGSSFLLDTGTDSVMIDCGPATTYKMTRMGFPTGQVAHLFLTHHHFDHNADFPCFALTRWDQSTSPEPPLRVYGPPPTAAFVDRLLGEKGAFVDDWKARVEHPVSQNLHKGRGGDLPRPAPAIEAKDVGPGPVAETDSWAATAARVHHVDPWLESLAFRFDTDRGSILFAGDCGDCPELRAIAEGVQTLVLGCTHLGGSKMESTIAYVCTGTREAAEIAAETGARRVILTHVSPAFCKPGMKERAIAAVARGYTGEVLLPDELTSVDLST